MRVISSDNTISISYENSFLCVVEEDNSENSFHIAVRTPSLQTYMPLATYNTKEEAMAEFKRMIEFASSIIGANSIFYLR